MVSRAVQGAGFKRGWRLLVLACVLLALGGCAVRFVYNQLDWMVPWYLDDYIELEGPQKALFKERLDAYLAWHRKQQLPLYAEFLEQVADRVGRGMSPADIAFIQTRTEQLAQDMIERLKPDMMDLFALASDAQVKALFKKFAEDNREYRKENVDISEKKQRRLRQKEVIRYAERWTGALTSAQRQLIVDWSGRFELMDADIYDTQLRWQDEFHRILLLRHDRAAYDVAFARLLDTPAFGRSEEMQRKLDANQTLLIGLYLALEQSLAADQRKHMMNKLRDYAQDFRELSNE